MVDRKILLENLWLTIKFLALLQIHQHDSTKIRAKTPGLAEAQQQSAGIVWCQASGQNDFGSKSITKS
ncbi:MAG: hypothetical protein Kow0027_24150 [Saprospiraceae bacterium]